MSITELMPPSELLPTAVEQDAPEKVTPPLSSEDQELIAFLKEELLISDDSIAIALRYAHQDRGPLPMILWRYGFVSLAQLNQIFDWMTEH